MTQQHHTGVTAEARGMGNVYRVEVVGKNGWFIGVRKNLTLALATAVQYARLLDAPRAVLDNSEES